MVLLCGAVVVEFDVVVFCVVCCVLFVGVVGDAGVVGCG